MAADFKIRNDDYVDRTQRSFVRQEFMATLGATLTHVGPGEVEIVLPYDPKLTQQHGFFHGGVLGTLADNAGGYSSFSLLAAVDSILTVEYKLNILAPAQGEKLLTRRSVARAGRRLT